VPAPHDSDELDLVAERDEPVASASIAAGLHREPVFDIALAPRPNSVRAPEPSAAVAQPDFAEPAGGISAQDRDGLLAVLADLIECRRALDAALAEQ
jgi:hypothetical protein